MSKAKSVQVYQSFGPAMLYLVSLGYITMEGRYSHILAVIIYAVVFILVGLGVAFLNYRSDLTEELVGFFLSSLNESALSHFAAFFLILLSVGNWVAALLLTWSAFFQPHHILRL